MKGDNMIKKSSKKNIASYILLGVLMLGIFYFFTVLNKTVNKLTYSELITSRAM